MKIDQNVVEVRLKILGITKADLARMLGVTRQRVHEMLTESRSFNVVERLAKVLSVPERSLILYDDEDRDRHSA